MSTSRRLVLLQPHWVIAHVMVLLVVVTFPMLGLWQLDRWHEERALQARIESRIDGPVVALTDVLDADTPPAARDDLQFQPVTATGTYVAEEEVAHRNRDLDGQGGFDWLTPLRLDDGTAVLVRRGFVPPSRAAGIDPTNAPPPSGEVTVSGWLELSADQPSGVSAAFAPSDPDTGTLDSVFHADVDRIDQQTTADLLPMILHLSAQEPAQADRLPVAQPVPEADLSQNLSYAVQWFVFATIAVIGYGIVLWRKWGVRTGDEATETVSATGRPT